VKKGDWVCVTVGEEKRVKKQAQGRSSTKRGGVEIRKRGMQEVKRGLIRGRGES